MSNEAPQAEALLSPTASSSADAPSWPRPRTPIPPHRLAKLANALGISTPVPPHQSPDSNKLSTSVPRSSAGDSWRSPTPSVASTSHLTTHSTSSSHQTRFLLHVIPPLNLPHETDSSDSLELTPPPPSASGYHTQFRRGTLVPVFPTLQLQLWAIAKEYALPSTVGMVLYLVTSSPNPSNLTPSPADSRKHLLDIVDEPGPRLSEDVWKHLWMRVAKVEHDSVPSRASTPNPVGLGFAFGGRSSPMSPDASSSNQNPLRPLVSAGRFVAQSLSTPLTPSVSTPSSASDLRTQTASSDPSHSEVNTPDSSYPPGSRANSLDLPGLHSPSLIPILAKVEFDIDKRRAAWFDPWVRSRRVNHKKREEQGRVRGEFAAVPLTEDESGGSSESDFPKPAPIALKLVDRQAVPRFLQSRLEHRDSEEEEIETGEVGEDYVPLESPIAMEDPDITARLGTAAGSDPLADVFGTDGDTWADIHAESSGHRISQPNPNVVPLALDGSALSEPLDPEGPLMEEGDDGREVEDLWDAHARPALSVAIPKSPPSAKDRRSSPTTAGTITATTFRKTAPPPLRLVPSSSVLVASAEANPLPSTGADSTKLPYLREGVFSSSEDETEGDSEGDPATFKRVKSPQEDDKRVGAFFEDLDLGLDFEDSGDFDDADPNDRRRSQYAMKAKLDEIERALVQFSPRRLKHELDQPLTHSPGSATLSINSRGPASPPRSQSAFLGLSNGSPPAAQPAESAVWPAVPYSSLNVGDEDDQDNSVGLDDFPSPPKLAINGVSRDIPISPYKQPFSASSPDAESAESKARRRELEGHEPSYPDIMPASLRRPKVSNSPIIPLSPDPFGRFPSEPAPPVPPIRLSEDGKTLEPPLMAKSHIKYSTFEIPTERQSSLSRNTSVTSNSDQPSTAPTSRFSIDSTDEQTAKNNRAALNPVRSIRTLWRKSRKASISSVAGVALAAQAQAKDSAGRSSPQPPLPTSVPRLKAPSPPPVQEVVTNAILPPGRRPSQAPGFEPAFMTSQALQKSRGESSINSIHFDQESPYPIRRSPQPPPASLSRASSSHASQYTRESQASRESQLRQPDRPPSSTGSVNTEALPSPSLPPEKNGTRKSILKSWRSPSISQIPGNVSDTSGRSSTEGKAPEPIPRRRRPSIIEMVRGSIVSGSALGDIPPSPVLPEQYVNANGNVNGSHFSTVRSTGRNTPSSFESSRLSSVASPPVAGSSLPPSPPRPGRAPSRPSQEDDQFELIDPPPLGHGKTPSLSYPYHDLDHQS